MEELEKMSLVELRLYGRKLGMRNATTFKKQELVGEIKKILEAQEGQEVPRASTANKPARTAAARKTPAKRSAARKTPAEQKNTGVEKTDENEGGVVAAEERTAVREPQSEERPGRKPAGRKPARRPDAEDRGTTAARSSRTMTRGGYTTNYPEVRGVKEERRYGYREDRSSGREDRRYSPREDRYTGREDRYAGREERNGSREDRYISRDDRGGNREDRYAGREERNGSREDRYSTREERSGSREDRYAGREERSGSREDRYSTRDDRGGSRESRYAAREERGGSREDRYTSREERGGSREDRYAAREERGGSREDRYISREERGGNREDRYAAREERGGSREDRHTVREEHGTGHTNPRGDAATIPPTELAQLDSGETKAGILEVMPEGYGFVRCDNYLPGEADVYVSPAMIRRFGLRSGDILVGNTRIKNQNEKFSALLYINTINGYSLEDAAKRAKFEHLTPVFPNERIRLEVKGSSNNISMRMMDLISPIGKGQRGMIVSQPKTGKTTLLKQVAKAVTHNHPKMHLIVLLIDERPEEVTDIKESIQGNNVEVIYSTFDELPENHKRVSEMVIERAKRLVEHGEDVMILLDSITRLARAYNLTVQPSGRTLSGGLDPAALHMPKRFFGAARNMREGGSLTILATALVDTGSKMDDVVFEEFKGTGNMEMVLDRSLSEKRLFPAIDLPRSSTRRDDLLLDQEELEANFLIRKAFGGAKSEEAVENIIAMFRKTRDNEELIQLVKKVKIV